MSYRTKRTVLVDYTRAYELPMELSGWWRLLTTHGGVTSRTW
jgi:hypothetical protein